MGKVFISCASRFARAKKREIHCAEQYLYIVCALIMFLMISMIIEILESIMSVKICCPVCNGKGKVDSDFGGGCPGGSKKQCPACCGTGMQNVSEDCYRPCRKTYVPYYPWNPCPNPWYTTPTITWSSSGSTTPTTGSTTYLGNNQTSYTL